MYVNVSDNSRAGWINRSLLDQVEHERLPRQAQRRMGFSKPESVQTSRRLGATAPGIACAWRSVGRETAWLFFNAGIERGRSHVSIVWTLLGLGWESQGRQLVSTWPPCHYKLTNVTSTRKGASIGVGKTSGVNAIVIAGLQARSIQTAISSLDE